MKTQKHYSASNSITERFNLELTDGIRKVTMKEGSNGYRPFRISKGVEYWETSIWMVFSERQVDGGEMIQIQTCRKHSIESAISDAERFRSTGEYTSTSRKKYKS